jgi:hypothetical protein
MTMAQTQAPAAVFRGDLGNWSIDKRCCRTLRQIGRLRGFFRVQTQRNPSIINPQIGVLPKLLDHQRDLQ